MEGSEAVASELAKFLAYLYFSRGNILSAAIGQLSSIQYFHRLVGSDLPLKHHFFRAAKGGRGRERALKGEEASIR